MTTTILEALIKLVATLTMIASAFIQGDDYTIDETGLITRDDGTQECVTASPCDYATNPIEDPSIIGTVSDEWKALNNGEQPE